MRSDEFPVGGKWIERNPVLGLHGIRRLLKDPLLLEVELTAVKELRLEGHGNVTFGLPFINDCDELDRVIETARICGAGEAPLGIFIETAAAISELPLFLDRGIREIFIGIKDLTQMILACDRSNSLVSHLYGARKRPVVDAITRIISACKGKDVDLVLFTTAEDVGFFLSQFPQLDGLSIAFGDYERHVIRGSAGGSDSVPEQPGS